MGANDGTSMPPGRKAFHLLGLRVAALSGGAPESHRFTGIIQTVDQGGLVAAPPYAKHRSP